MMLFLAQANAAKKIDLVEDLRLVLPEEPRPWGLIIAGIVAALVAIGLLVWWLRKSAAARRAAVPPEVTALKELEELHPRMAELNANEYALRVSLILRTYIEGQFNLRAPTRSTEEFLAEAEGSTHLHERDRKAVGLFLRACDRVKFALGALAMDGKESLHKSAKKFVEETAAEAARVRRLEAQAAKEAKKKPAPAVEEEPAGPVADFTREYRPQVFVNVTAPAAAVEPDLPDLNPREVAGR
jgi:hypothetical protein